MNNSVLTEQDRDLVFRNARSYKHWLDTPVEDRKLEEIYELMKFAPTAVNGNPMRVLFLRDHAAKERLRPALMAKNLEQVMTAPITAIFAYDLEFYKHLDHLYPQHDPKVWNADNPDLIKGTADFNCTLQIAYFMMAARGCGLDCGPIAGFNREVVDKEFFAKDTIKSSMLCNFGYGDKDSLHQRAPRFAFDEVCKVI